MTSPTNLIRMRAATEADVGFIFNSWLKSYRSSLFAKHISSSVYFSGHHKFLEALIPNAEIKIACNDQDPTQIYGYICAQYIEGILVVHYVYVKQDYRNLGIGKMLLDQFDHSMERASCYTHQTKIGEQLAIRFNMIYHPYLAMGVFNEPEQATVRIDFNGQRSNEPNSAGSQTTTENEVKE